MMDIEHNCSILIEWFQDNHLTLHAERCHLIVSGYKYEVMYAKVGDGLLCEENSGFRLSWLSKSTM